MRRSLPLIGDVLDLDRGERAKPDVHRRANAVNAFCGQGGKDGIGKVQPSRRGGDGPGMLGINRLVS